VLRRGNAGLKDNCAHVSSVLGSAVSQVRPHFPRFAKTLHHLQLFPKKKNEFQILFEILLYFQEPHEKSFVEIYGLQYQFCTLSKLCGPARQNETI